MIEITTSSRGQERRFLITKMPFTFGRHPNPDCPELVLADPFVSRTHVQIAEDTEGQLRVRCLGASPIELPKGEMIQRDHELAVSLPAEIRIGRSQVRIARIASGVSFLSTPPPRSIVTDFEQTLESPRMTIDETLSLDRLIEWFEHLVALQESATGTDSMFRQAAKAVVELIGLDRCVVLCRGTDDMKDQWCVKTEHGRPAINEAVFSRTVVAHVSSSLKTVFDNSVELSSANSLAGVSAFVGSPIIDAKGTMVACLFGVRRVDRTSLAMGVQPIEAQLVQVIAGILSARISRLAAEAEQVRTQVQLEQFASPALVREMQSNPQWLDATERELTFMFGDIRKFSQISQILSAHQTFELVRDVMDCMTEVIHQCGGFIFNFAGDGIAAMWNAPEPNDCHAQDACQAAVEIQKRLCSAVASWTSQIGEEVEVGLGIHTGVALIGNSGSKERLKYSPLGHAVNLASRIEGATKYLGAPILITQATIDQVNQPLITRDLGEISVVGISEGVRVHQVAASAEVDENLWNCYEQARCSFESKDLENAKLQARRVQEDYPNDVPTRILIDQIESGRIATPWQLPNK